MKEESLSYYKKAGEIAKEVLEEGLKKIKPGVKLLEVAEFVEARIIEKGGKPAFPCNISVNEIAAHYSPTAWDEGTFEKGDLVKLDIGVHVNGYIADVAKSIDLGNKSENKKLIEASEEALKNAIDMIKPGVKTSEIGETIEETIKGFGFVPVSNLTGHQLQRWRLHGGMFIPNVKIRGGEEIKEGDVIAIEPFATNGFGRVVDQSEAIIFRYLQDRPLRMKEARVILQYAKENFNTLPFAERWVANLVPRFKLSQALRQLIYSKAIHAYHILREKNKGIVSQAEHTVIVTKEGCEVTTGEI
ncbi:MAG: type II methionyl aminopeptidase [Candidatus Hydrothermarchaeota archaeon]|nr:MAG: type II methionyl aminopeptidase [Candidatus Hydrothermarchaeota archaeon]